MAEKTRNIKGKEQNGCMVSSSEIAKLIGKTVKTVQNLTNDGILPCVETENGKRVSRKYDKYETIRAYIEYIEERSAEKNGGEQDREKGKVEIDIKKTKLRMEKLRLYELEGRMHSSKDVEDMTTDLVLNVRSNLLAMPGRLAVELAGISDASEISERINCEVCEILEDMSNYKYDPEEYKKRIRERQGWINDNQDDEE